MGLEGEGNEGKGQESGDGLSTPFHPLIYDNKNGGYFRLMSGHNESVL